jgi:hypothetical protein
MTKSLAQLKESAYRIPIGTKRITLECGHVALYVHPFPPVGEPAFCRECGAWSARAQSEKPPGGPSQATRRSLRCRGRS